jgi:hypothetical protein
MSNSKKIFLSHKGIDKALVIDFKETLKSLGYDPWIDEDAMPAGTQLERGLLQGMKDSCGVIFFITPAIPNSALERRFSRLSKQIIDFILNKLH